MNGKPTTLSMLMGEANRGRRGEGKPFVSFTQKLYDMVSDPAERAIQWNRAGDGFHVLDTTQLCEHTFPHYFKHNSWPSFTRQLNMYGFQRTGSHQPCEPSLEFKHPHFKYGQPALLRFIQRRVVSAAPDFARPSYARPDPQDPEALMLALREQAARHEETLQHVAHILTHTLTLPNPRAEIARAIQAIHQSLDHSAMPSPPTDHSSLKHNGFPLPSLTAYLPSQPASSDLIQLPPLRYSS